MVKKYSLQELVQYKKDLETQVDGGESTEEVQELAVLAEALLKGKVDQAARFKAGLEAHIDAAKKNLQSLQEMLSYTEDLMEEAVLSTPEKRLEGVTYTMRMQNNSRAAVIIEDESKLPVKFYKAEFAVEFENDLDSVLFYAGVLLKRVVSANQLPETAPFLDRLDVSPEEKGVLEDHFSFSLSRKDLEAALKTGEVPGARLERGQHLRVEAGKSKSRLLKQSVEVEGVKE